MLDRLPPSLQLHVLLEWLSPKTVCAVARAGSSQLRRAILTAPSAFRAAKDEIVSDACIRWFQLRRPPPCPPLAFSTTVTVAANGMFVHHQSNGKTHRDEDDLPAVTWANSDYLCGGVAARLGGGVSVPDRLAKDPSIGRYFQMERIFAGLGWFWTDEEEDGAEPFFTGNNNNNNNLSPYDEPSSFADRTARQLWKWISRRR